MKRKKMVAISTIITKAQKMGKKRTLQKKRSVETRYHKTINKGRRCIHMQWQENHAYNV